MSEFLKSLGLAMCLVGSSFISTSEAATNASCGISLKSIIGNLPWVAAKKLEYSIKIEVVVDDATKKVVAEKQFSSRQGTSYLVMDIPDGGSGATLMPFPGSAEEVRARRSSAHEQHQASVPEDLAASSTPDGTFRYLTASLQIEPGRAWRRTGGITVRLYNIHSYSKVPGSNANEHEFIGGVDLNNEMQMEFRAPQLKGYFVRYTSAWTPINPPKTQSVSSTP